MSENSLLIKAISGAIIFGLGITGAGVTYVIDYEKRISLLEARVDTPSGISTTLIQSEDGNQTREETGAFLGISSDESVFGTTIAEGCLRLISSYDTIVSAGSIYSSEERRLEALQAQMAALGCTAFGEKR
jgi:hypothetical protein